MQGMTARSTRVLCVEILCWPCSCSHLVLLRKTLASLAMGTGTNVPIVMFSFGQRSCGLMDKAPPS